MCAFLVFAFIGALLFLVLAGSDPCSLIGIDSCPLDTGGCTWGDRGPRCSAPGRAPSRRDRCHRNVHRPHRRSVEQLAPSPPCRATGASDSGSPMERCRPRFRLRGRLILFNLIAAPFYLLLLITASASCICSSSSTALLFGRDVAGARSSRHGRRLQARLAKSHARRQVHRRRYLQHPVPGAVCEEVRGFGTRNRMLVTAPMKFCPPRVDLSQARLETPSP